MNTWSFYDPTTGLFSRGIFHGSRNLLALNTPENMVALEGEYPPNKYRVDVGGTGLPVEYRPPSPQASLLYTYEWDPVSWGWQQLPTVLREAELARERRQVLLTACDWVVTKATETSTPIPDEWLAYRAALRDVTAQSGFPSEIVWPVPPS